MYTVCTNIYFAALKMTKPTDIWCDFGSRKHAPTVFFKRFPPFKQI